MSDDDFDKSAGGEMAYAFRQQVAIQLAAHNILASEFISSSTEKIITTKPGTSAQSSGYGGYRDISPSVAEADLRARLAIIAAGKVADELYGSKVPLASAGSSVNMKDAVAITDRMVALGLITDDQKSELLATAFNQAKEILATHTKELDSIVQALMVTGKVKGQIGNFPARHNTSDPKTSP